MDKDDQELVDNIALTAQLGTITVQMLVDLLVTKKVIELGDAVTLFGTVAKSAENIGGDHNRQVAATAIQIAASYRKRAN